MSFDESFRVDRFRVAVLAALVPLLAAGCGDSQPISPQFRLNFENRDPAEVGVEQRQAMVDVMVAAFGEPDKPHVMPETNLDANLVRLAAGPSVSTEGGQTGGLFRRHCAHCHGVTGDGAGPTAAFLTPYPRDYRRGIFKFKDTQRASRPTDDDLRRVIVDGIPGTAMPSFRLLPRREIDALVEYVKYLSMRGETELLLYGLIVEDEEEATRDLIIEEALSISTDAWGAAEDEIIEVPPRPSVDTPEQLAASIAAGHEIFHGTKAACTKCHGPTALGDGGSEADLYDDWNRDKNADTSGEKFWSLPVQMIRPRNLRMGVYRGGRRPADIYRRIHAGINGTPMPAAGPGPGSPEVLTPEQIWQVVDYVRSLPYEDASATNHEQRMATLRPR